MILIPIFCLLIGALLGVFFKQPVRNEAGLYLAVACLAGLDTVCGGIRSSMEGKFHGDVFITGFITNVLIAFGLAWLGDRIGANVFLVCAFIFGTRIFNNLSLIRRFLLSQCHDARERSRQAQVAASQAAAKQQAEANS